MTAALNTEGQIDHPNWRDSRGARVPVGWVNLPPMVQGAMRAGLLADDAFAKLTGPVLLYFLALSKGASEKVRQSEAEGRKAWAAAPVGLTRDRDGFIHLAQTVEKAA